ncbi:MAG: UvrB/UvrC motif-containing protein [Phycisphaerales bacterium]
MNCDQCDKPAVVHETRIVNGEKREVHLCTEHAAEAGFVVHQSSAHTAAFKQFFISAGESKSGKASAKACSSCGMTFADFRKSGTLGCAECYRAFESQLSPLIERAQNGGTHHIGHAPAVSEQARDRQLLMQKLIRELDRAVAAEEYERAAALRDRLNAIEPVQPRDDAGTESS